MADAFIVVIDSIAVILGLAFRAYTIFDAHKKYEKNNK